MNSENMSRQTLFDTIGAVSFAMDDLRLYLDTHPNCSEALTCFNEYKSRRHDLVAQYTAQYGPLDAYYPDSDGGCWNWNDGPMPWKGGVN